MRKSNKEEYPKNLLLTIDRFTEEEIEDIISDKEKVASLEYMIATCLNEREAVIIHKYFRDKMSMEQVGQLEIVGEITRGRIYEICNRCIRKLRLNPERLNKIRYGLEGYIKKSIEENKKYYETMLAKNMSYEEQCRAAETLKLDRDVAEIGLTVRAYNCLRRAGIDTGWQLFVMDQKELAKIRNCGKDTVLEIVSKCKEYYGFDILLDKKENEEELTRRKDILVTLGYYRRVSGLAIIN